MDGEKSPRPHIDDYFKLCAADQLDNLNEGLRKSIEQLKNLSVGQHRAWEQAYMVRENLFQQEAAYRQRIDQLSPAFQPLWFESEPLDVETRIPSVRKRGLFGFDGDSNYEDEARFEKISSLQEDLGSVSDDECRRNGTSGQTPQTDPVSETELFEVQHLPNCHDDGFMSTQQRPLLIGSKSGDQVQNSHDGSHSSHKEVTFGARKPLNEEILADDEIGFGNDVSNEEQCPKKRSLSECSDLEEKASDGRPEIMGGTANLPAVLERRVMESQNSVDATEDQADHRALFASKLTKILESEQSRNKLEEQQDCHSDVTQRAENSVDATNWVPTLTKKKDSLDEVEFANIQPEENEVQDEVPGHLDSGVSDSDDETVTNTVVKYIEDAETLCQDDIPGVRSAETEVQTEASTQTDEIDIRGSHTLKGNVLLSLELLRGAVLGTQESHIPCALNGTAATLTNVPFTITFNIP